MKSRYRCSFCSSFTLFPGSSSSSTTASQPFSTLNTGLSWCTLISTKTCSTSSTLGTCNSRWAYCTTCTFIALYLQKMIRLSKKWPYHKTQVDNIVSSTEPKQRNRISINQVNHTIHYQYNFSNVASKNSFAKCIGVNAIIKTTHSGCGSIKYRPETRMRCLKSTELVLKLGLLEISLPKITRLLRESTQRLLILLRHDWGHLMCQENWCL